MVKVRAGGKFLAGSGVGLEKGAYPPFFNVDTRGLVRYSVLRYTHCISSGTRTFWKGQTASNSR